MPDRAAEPEGRGGRLAAQRGEYFELVADVPARRGGERLRVLQLPVRQDTTSSRSSSLDNIQVINRCKHSPALLRGHEHDFELIRSVVKAKLPGCFHYLITTFFYPPVRKERTTLVPADPPPGDPRGEVASRASTCSSTRPRRRNRALPETLKAGCPVPRLRAAPRPDRGPAWTGTSPTAPSARRASSTTSAPRAASSPAAASRS